MSKIADYGQNFLDEVEAHCACVDAVSAAVFSASVRATP